MIRFVQFPGPSARHALVTIEGDVDRADASELDALRQELRSASHVHVELSTVGSASVVLLSWLIDLRRELGGAGGRLTSGPVSPPLRRMLERLDLLDLVEGAAPADAAAARRLARTLA